MEPNEEFDSGARIVGSSMNDDFGGDDKFDINQGLDDTPF